MPIETQSFPFHFHWIYSFSFFPLTNLTHHPIRYLPSAILPHPKGFTSKVNNPNQQVKPLHLRSYASSDADPSM